MYKITLLSVIVACASAVDVRSFLQDESETITLPISLSLDHCNFTWTPPGGGTPPGNTSTPICVCPLGNITGLPPLGQAELTAFHTEALATVGSHMDTTPDTRINETAAAQYCTCETGTFIKRKS